MFFVEFGEPATTGTRLLHEMLSPAMFVSWPVLIASGVAFAKNAASEVSACRAA